MLADLARTSPRIPANVCPLCYVTPKLDADDRDGLDDCLRSDGVQFTGVARELALLGWKVSADAVGRHARGECLAGVKYCA